MSPKSRKIKTKINYRDYTKIKSFGTAKGTINKTNRQPVEREMIFANNIADKGIISKIYKEHIHLITRKLTSNPIRKWAEDPNRYLSKEDIQMANRHMKRHH